MNPVLSGRVKNQATPTASDIKQTVARTKPQLATDVSELLLLCRLQAVFCGLEVSARVHHGLVKPQLVEVIRNVVVKTYRPPVACSGVTFTSQPGGLGCRAVHGRKPQQPTSQSQFLLRAPGFLREMLGQSKYGEDVSADIEFVVDVSFTEGDLLGGAE